MPHRHARVQLCRRHRVPSVLVNKGPVLQERADGVVVELVLEDDEAGRLGAGEPLLHVRGNRREGCAARYDAPVLSVLVPEDGGEPEDLLCDCADARVNVSVRRAPEARELPIRRVVDNLHCPPELGEKLFVGERGHVRVSPGVHGDVVIEVVDGGEESLSVIKNVDTDHKVSCFLLLLGKIGVKLWGCL